MQKLRFLGKNGGVFGYDMLKVITLFTTEVISFKQLGPDLLLVKG